VNYLIYFLLGGKVKSGLLKFKDLWEDIDKLRIEIIKERYPYYMKLQ